MHILEIVSFLPPYGGYFAIEQAEALQQAGGRVGMLYCQQLGITVDGVWTWLRGNGSGFMVHGSGVMGHGFDFVGRFFRGMPRAIRANEERFCGIVSEMFDEYVSRYGRPDVLHAQAAKWAGVAAMGISRRTGIPYFVTEHFSRGSYDMDFGRGWTHDLWARDLIRECYENARCVIPVAEELVEDTACYFGRDYRYEAVSNITDVEFFVPPVPRRERSHDPFRFCCLAIANRGEFYRKGYDVLARALRGVNGCELHVAGRDTDSRRFRRLFEKYYGARMPESVVVHGDLSREGVRDLLYRCDALVLASRSEVQPLVVLEALSTGIPVVGTEAIPQNERIAGGVVIARTGDATSLVDGMRRVMAIGPQEGLHDRVVEISSAVSVSRRLMAVFNGGRPL